LRTDSDATLLLTDQALQMSRAVFGNGASQASFISDLDRFSAITSPAAARLAFAGIVVGSLVGAAADAAFASC
jgi:hypothetical protein